MATIQETKQAYNEWQAYRKALKKSTTIDRSESFFLLKKKIVDGMLNDTINITFNNI